MINALDPDNMPIWIAKLWPTELSGPAVIAGVNNDDCGVMRWNHRLLVITTDYINSKPIVLELGIGDYRCLGRLVVATNLADLCGSGAEPRALLTAITMPKDSKTEDFKSLMKGIKLESKKWGLPVIGGDTKLGESLTILGVAIGSAMSKKNLFLKNQAKPADLLWLSGNLGSCSAAVLGLVEGGFPKKWKEWAIKSLTVPNIPLKKSKEVSQVGIGRGGIDISDGLGNDLSKMCEASGTGVILDVSRIPVAKQVIQLAQVKGLPPWALAFSSGGEFQFIVTTRKKDFERMSKLGFHFIGEMTKNNKMVIRLKDGKTVPLPKAGHRDARNLSFYQEIVLLSEEVASVE